MAGRDNPLSFATPGQRPATDGQYLTATGYRQRGAGITNAVVRMKTQNALK